VALANGQVDLATDYDRNLNAMIEAGRIRADQVRVVWTPEPLPNDALAVRRNLDPAVKTAILDAPLRIDAAQAAKVLPTHYTGWVAARPDSYADIEAARRCTSCKGVDAPGGVAARRLRPVRHLRRVAG